MVSKATEITAAKVYKVMHVTIQQRPIAKMPCSDGDGDGFRLAAPLAASRITPY
jgi:hypothetical protein